MALVNTHFLNLQENYLFADIAKRVKAFKVTHPKADVISLGIGDVTQPLPPACIEAMHKAVDELANADTFRGYGPEQGYSFLTDAIIEHHIGRVVVGLRDPNPLVAGKGIEKLMAAGIEVEVADSLEKELRYQNRVFLKYITTGMPWVVMKYAMTLDGKICTRRGDSKWVSGEEARLRVHYLRRELTGILCGIGTVLSDNPSLTTRIAKYPAARNPIRIVADRHARLPLVSNLVRTAKEVPTVVVYAEGADLHRLAQLNRAGVKTWCCNTPQDLLMRAGKEKIDGILLEGGGTLNESFIREGLVDEVFAFIAPKIVGKMAQALSLEDVKVERYGEDLLVRGLVSKDSE